MCSCHFDNILVDGDCAAVYRLEGVAHSFQVHFKQFHTTSVRVLEAKGTRLNSKCVNISTLNILILFPKI